MRRHHPARMLYRPGLHLAMQSGGGNYRPAIVLEDSGDLLVKVRYNSHGLVQEEWVHGSAWYHHPGWDHDDGDRCRCPPAPRWSTLAWPGSWGPRGGQGAIVRAAIFWVLAGWMARLAWEERAVPQLRDSQRHRKAPGESGNRGTAPTRLATAAAGALPTGWFRGRSRQIAVGAAPDPSPVPPAG
jgi:hypothetical protein